jgi:hypothetical protein
MANGSGRMTMEFRDTNQNGVEDRAEGILGRGEYPSNNNPMFPEQQDVYERQMQLMRLLNGVFEDKELDDNQKNQFATQLLRLSGVTAPQMQAFMSNPENQQSYMNRETMRSRMPNASAQEYSRVKSQITGEINRVAEMPPIPEMPMPMAQPTYDIGRPSPMQPLPAMPQARPAEPMRTSPIYENMVLRVDPASRTGFAGGGPPLTAQEASDLFNRNFQAARQERGPVAGGYGVVPTPQGGVPVSNRMVAEQMRQGWQQGLTPVLTGSTASFRPEGQAASPEGNMVKGVNIQGANGATIPFEEYQRRRAAMGAMR